MYVAEQEAKALLAKAQAEAGAQIAAAEAEARSIMLKSVEIARMLGYTVTESGEEEVVYTIVFDEAHNGADIAEYLKIYRISFEMGRQASAGRCGRKRFYDNVADGARKQSSRF